MARNDVKVMFVETKVGEAMDRPASRLLPASQFATSTVLARMSLRMVNSITLDSSCTRTLKRSLVMLGLLGCTSVGPGTAGACTNLPLPSVSRGIAAVDRLVGNAFQYGPPYATWVNTPLGDHGYTDSMVRSAFSSRVWSDAIGRKSRLAVANIV